MRWSDLELAQGVWRFTAGKTGRAVVIPLHPGLQQHWVQRAGTDEPPQWVEAARAAFAECARSYVDKLKRRARAALAPICMSRPPVPNARLLKTPPIANMSNLTIPGEIPLAHPAI